MKKTPGLIKGFFTICIFLIATCLPVEAFTQNPEISIVTDQTPGIPVTNGLNKLTNALQAKNINFEKVASMNEAKGKAVIVTGLASGEGEAARLLKAGNHEVPAVSEALTIRKTDWQNKPVWVISGFDDRGLKYGLLDVAKRISWSKNRTSPFSEVKEITEKPAVSDRAISIYTMNRAYWESRVQDERYWARYLDMLAESRFNTLVIIFGYENGGFLAPC